jgi:hypothetical protein
MSKFIEFSHILLTDKRHAETILSLSDDERKLLELHLVGNKSLKEISVSLCVKYEVLRKNYCKILRKLKHFENISD